MHGGCVDIAAELDARPPPGLSLNAGTGQPAAADSGPALTVTMRQRYDRGHRNWNKHMRELLNHSAAWDYETAWAPAMHAHKLAVREQRQRQPEQPVQPTHSADARVRPALCDNAQTAAMLRRIAPPELALARLRPHSST